MNRYLAEFMGTFCLVFFGCGAVVVDALGGGLGHAGVSLVFGLIVMVGIYAVGNVSGAHFNPAVTIGFCAVGRMGWRLAPGYISSQCLAAIAACAVLRYVFMLDAASMGATLPGLGLSVWQVGVAEGLLTFLLMYVILNVSTGHMEKGIMAGVAVGGMIAVEAFVCGPMTGASMNPARSLGPAVISGNLSVLWVYLVAPTVGAVLASPMCKCIQGDACCPDKS